MILSQYYDTSIGNTHVYIVNSLARNSLSAMKSQQVHQAPVSFSRRLAPSGFKSTGMVIQSLCLGSFALANSAATFRRLRARGLCNRPPLESEWFHSLSSIQPLHHSCQWQPSRSPADNTATIDWLKWNHPLEDGLRHSVYIPDAVTSESLAMIT